MSDPTRIVKGFLVAQVGTSYCLQYNGAPVPIGGVRYWADRANLVAVLWKHLGIKVDRHGYLREADATANTRKTMIG